MKVHHPDTGWLIRWMAVLNPNDEIFKKSYQFKRPKQEIEISEEEDFLRNDDDFFTDLPVLDDKTIRTTNRIRVPKKIQVSKKLKLAQLSIEKAQARLEHLIAYRETLESDSESELEFEQSKEDGNARDVAMSNQQEQAQDQPES